MILIFITASLKCMQMPKNRAEASCWFFKKKQTLRCKGVNGKALLPNMRNIESSAPLNPAFCILRKVCSDQNFPGFPPPRTVRGILQFTYCKSFAQSNLCKIAALTLSACIFNTFVVQVGIRVLLGWTSTTKHLLMHASAAPGCHAGGRQFFGKHKIYNPGLVRGISYEFHWMHAPICLSAVAIWLLFISSAATPRDPPARQQWRQCNRQYAQRVHNTTIAFNRCDFRDTPAIQPGFFWIMSNTLQEHHIQVPVRNIASTSMFFMITYSKHAIEFDAHCSCPRKLNFNVQYNRNTGMLYVVMIYRLITCSATYLEHCWCITSSLNAIRGDRGSVPNASLYASQQHPYTRFREKHAINSTCNNNDLLISYRGHAFNWIHIIRLGEGWEYPPERKACWKCKQTYRSPGDKLTRVCFSCTSIC